MANRPVHFDIEADDVERAIMFYKTVFGWQFQSYGEFPGYGEYFGVMTGNSDDGDKLPGIDGGLSKRESSVPRSERGTAANAFVCTMQVDDYDAVHDAILRAGGTVVKPKFALEGMAWQGYYEDTEGNTFGLHQADKNAK